MDPQKLTPSLEILQSKGLPWSNGVQILQIAIGSLVVKKLLKFSETNPYSTLLHDRPIRNIIILLSGWYLTHFVKTQLNLVSRWSNNFSS